MPERKRKVLVTGASRGIGRAIAVALAKSGYDIVVHYNKNHEAAERTANDVAKLGITARLLQFDIADRESTKRAIVEEIEKSSPFYGVVCNAGFTIDAPFPAVSGADWDAVVHTNLDGFYNVVQPLLMPMIRERCGGRIVTMASASGVIGNRGQVGYSAAKAGIIGATKALALELAKRNITVNCVAPGLIETDMTADVPRDVAVELVPMRRFGTVDEVAGIINFLFSESAAYITRQVIAVNGGLH